MASALPAQFGDDIEPKPVAAESYKVSFGFPYRWPAIELAPDTRAEGLFPDVCEAGKPLSIRYGRTPADLQKSGEASHIRLHYRIDGGPVQTKTIADGTRDLLSGQILRFDAKIDVDPAAKGEIEYWFELETTDGQIFWDSDFGKNYRADIVPAAGVGAKFDQNWNEVLSGPLRAGESVRILYDTDRLKQFLRQTHTHGAETWNITAHVRFDDGPVLDVPLTIPKGAWTEMVTFEAAIKVPLSAKKMKLWFEGNSYGGSVFGGPAWDSNFGQNYEFEIMSA